jgi:predicted porin
MKKHLIAAAVAGAFAVPAMAQVTLSGNVGFGWENYKFANSAKSSGLENTDGQLVASGSEDLGGGMKASFSGAMQWNRHRGAAPTLRDATVALSGGFGTISIGSIEAGNGIQGLGGAGAPVRGLQEETLGVGSGPTPRPLFSPGPIDLISYTLPAFGPVTLNVLYGEVGAGTGGTRNGTVSAATSDGSTVALVGARYSAGPLAAALDYTTYDGPTASTASDTTDNRIRVSGRYDLGVAAIGLGYETRSYKFSGEDITTTLVGVSVPLGALSIGANYAVNSRDNRTNGDITGLDLGASYALSKRTAVGVFYQKQENDTQEGTFTRVRLLHSF